MLFLQLMIQPRMFWKPILIVSILFFIFFNSSAFGREIPRKIQIHKQPDPHQPIPHQPWQCLTCNCQCNCHTTTSTTSQTTTSTTSTNEKSYFDWFLVAWNLFKDVFTMVMVIRGAFFVEKKFIATMEVYERYKQRLIKIINDRPINLANEVRSITIPFFNTTNISPNILRQRAFILILTVNEMRNVPAYRSYVNTILDEILFCVSSFLERQDEEYMNALSTVEFANVEIVTDTIPIILQLKPQKSSSAIKALYKITDENCGVANLLKRALRPMIIESPVLVVDWIRCFKFEEFKMKYLGDLIVSIMTQHMDLNALLITDYNYAQKTVEFLDKALDRKTNKGELFDGLRSRLTDVDITKKITKIAKEYNINTSIYCKNCVQKRRLADFMYNIHQRSKEERAQLSIHCVQDFNEISNYDVIRALTAWEKKDRYAGVAFGRIYGLDDAELAKVLPEYKDVLKWDEEKIVAKMKEFNLALTSEAYIHEFFIEGNYTVYLIDDSQKLRFAMKKLSENDKIAFDVEANYVCQNAAGIQQACLIQIALKDCVLLVDIYTLIQKVSDEHIKVFFEMFLGCATDRIVFDVRSDLNLLRQTFDWMPEYLQRVQPPFHCVQRFVKLVQTSDTYKELFEEVPNPSLKEVAAKWLDIDMSKVQRQGNWLKRPLSKEQMIYAAMDARYTLDLYYYIQKKLYERNLADDMTTLCVTPKMIDRKKTKARKGEKETMEEILSNVQAKINDMRETLHNLEKAENVTIVVDFAFLSIAPILRQFGYKTFDQRDVPNGEHFTRDEVVTTLSNFLKDRIADGTITHCYLLTDENSNLRFTNKVEIDELKIINCGLDETESSIICAVMYDTKSVFDITDVAERCTKCGSSDYAVDFPADLYRVIYIHYAKNKQFFGKLKCEDNSHEILENLQREKVVELHDQMMTYRITDICAASFHLGDKIIGQLNYEMENGEPIETKETYKCNTRVFQNLGTKSHVRFCVNCFEFF